MQEVALPAEAPEGSRSSEKGLAPHRHLREGEAIKEGESSHSTPSSLERGAPATATTTGQKRTAGEAFAFAPPSSSPFNEGEPSQRGEGAGGERRMEEAERGEERTPATEDVKSATNVMHDTHHADLTSPKASSRLVYKWLKENYETAEESSLPRSALFDHYLQFCEEEGLESINAASFGKLIRTIFPQLKTRRLGTRGNSKYHYYGIRIKPTSKLASPTSDDSTSSSSSTSPSSSSTTGHKRKSSHKKESATSRGRQSTSSSKKAKSQQSSALPLGIIPVEDGIPGLNAASFATIPTINTKQLPDFVDVDHNSLPPDLSHELVQSFMRLYQAHCQHILDTISGQNLMDLKQVLSHFWQGLSPQFNPLLSSEDFAKEICDKDHLLYTIIINALIPNVLQELPLNVYMVRDFSKNFETWLSMALEGLPTILCAQKLHVCSKFTQTLRKHACLNHLAQASRQVLNAQNGTHIAQMLADWEAIDFSFIATQADWLCPAGEETAALLQEEFRHFLQQRCEIEQWAHWLQTVVDRFLKKCIDLRQLGLSSQQLLLKWSFYNSLIIRDLTIRNASTFGSFHVLRTFFDEYLAYTVEQRLYMYHTQTPYLHEEATNRVPAAMIPTSAPTSSNNTKATSTYHPHRSPSPPYNTQRPSSPSSLTSVTPRLINNTSPLPPPATTAISATTTIPTASTTTTVASREEVSSSPSLSSSSLPPSGIASPKSKLVSPSSASSSSSSSMMHPPSTTNNVVLVNSRTPTTVAAAGGSGGSGQWLSPSVAEGGPGGDSLPLLGSYYPPIPPSSTSSTAAASSNNINDGAGFFDGFARAPSFSNGLPSYFLPSSSKASFSLEPGVMDVVGVGGASALTSSSFRKPSFGSFGSFSSEFTRSLFRSSFDRSGSIDRGSLDRECMPQLFLNLSTPHINFNSFSAPLEKEQDSTASLHNNSAASPSTTSSSSPSITTADSSYRGDSSRSSTTTTTTTSASSSSPSAPTNNVPT
ncbi:DNA-binding protein RFX2 isoform X2 [Balamuthia mandrillaris]